MADMASQVERASSVYCVLNCVSCLKELKVTLTKKTAMIKGILSSKGMEETLIEGNKQGWCKDDDGWFCDNCKTRKD